MKSQIFQYEHCFQLETGGVFPSLNVAYLPYGTLNEKADNVIWVCHALTANSEVTAWWPGMLGAGKLLDTEKYFIVCPNIIGSCYGSTGPLSTNPETNLPWYRSFPELTIRDLVKAHEILRMHLGIKSIFSCIGGAIGGFQALEYSIMYPELIRNLVFIAGSVQISPWANAFNQSQRLAIEADPSYLDEEPYGGSKGLKCARSIALLSYRNEQSYNATQREDDPTRTLELRASSYQNYQGDKLVKRFDAYTYHALTRLMDTHNIVRDRGSLGDAIRRIKARVLSIGISSDQLFPVHEQKILAHIARGEFAEIESSFGHDGFLLEETKITSIVKEFWQQREEIQHLKKQIYAPQRELAISE